MKIYKALVELQIYATDENEALDEVKNYLALGVCPINVELYEIGSDNGAKNEQ